MLHITLSVVAVRRRFEQSLRTRLNFRRGTLEKIENIFGAQWLQFMMLSGYHLPPSGLGAATCPARDISGFLGDKNVTLRDDVWNSSIGAALECEKSTGGG